MVILLVAAGCATTPTGRRQLKLVSPAQMSRLGDEAYSRMKQETPVSKDRKLQAYVQCVAREVTGALPPPHDAGNWEVTVFEQDDSINAFALPGGNIGVYTGLLEVTENRDQLAAVISHEVAHVTADHSNARISTNYATRFGLSVLDAFIGGGSAQGNQIMSLLGLGAQVGVLLPYNRAQETEADVLGLKYMAEAGFDPRQSVELWRNMARAGGGGPPEFLSTHPSGDTRISTLKRHMPEAVQLYRRARSAGKRPDCRPPGK
jgi:predicted Zn-dependent protease